jgi:hypothetical protein
MKKRRRAHTFSGIVVGVGVGNVCVPRIDNIIIMNYRWWWWK